MNHFHVDGPAVVSFSGGRTSAFMLHRILEVSGGQLGQDVHALFADTGKERDETYAFVRECSTRWGVPIHWVHRCTARYSDDSVCSCITDGAPTPFEMLITDRSFLPNPVMRFCTQELKIKPMKTWMLNHDYEHWTNIVGLRADEPRRVARMRAKSPERWDVDMPLAKAGVTVADVRAFWRAQPFDLQLQPWEGNCDICFLKGRARRARVMLDRPELAPWWITQETRMGATFRDDGPSYARLLEQTRTQLRLPLAPTVDDDDLIACACTD